MSFSRNGRRTLRAAVSVFVGLMLVVMTASFLSAAADGAGTMTVNNPTAAPGPNQTFVFDFNNDDPDDFVASSQIQMTIPPLWTVPTGHITVVEGAGNGTNSCDPGTVSITGMVVIIPMTCGHDDHLTITYSNVLVPAAGTYTFATETRDATRNQDHIGTSPQVIVAVPTLTISSPAGGTYGTSVTLHLNGAHFGASRAVSFTFDGSPASSSCGNTNGSGAFTNCTITVTPANLGSRTVGASTTGPTAAGLSATQTFNISAKALSITANAQSKTYGQILTLGTTEFTPSGLVFSDTVTGVTLASSGAAANAAVGSYSITANAAVFGSGSAANYNITYNPGTLTVDKAALSIRADDRTKTFGQTLTMGAGQTQFTLAASSAPKTSRASPLRAAAL